MFFSGDWALISPATVPGGILQRLVVERTRTHTTRSARGAPIDVWFDDLNIERYVGASKREEYLRPGLVGGAVAGVGS